jgi:hypothetical protein
MSAVAFGPCGYTSAWERGVGTDAWIYCWGENFSGQLGDGTSGLAIAGRDRSVGSLKARSAIIRLTAA